MNNEEKQFQNLWLLYLVGNQIQFGKDVKAMSKAKIFRFLHYINENQPNETTLEIFNNIFNG